MEEFSRRDVLDLAGAPGTRWPEECRNCGTAYPPALFDAILRELNLDPTVDYLRVASLCVKAHCSTFHYCCINNARPIHLYSSGSLPDPGDIYAVNSGGLLIEHGLGEWYDVHWDLDEDHPTHCAPGLSGEVDDGGFSLFHHTGH